MDRFLLPRSTPGSLKIIVFPAENFFFNSPLEGDIDFCSILEANMPPLCSQNPSKPLKTPVLRGINMLMAFYFDFSSIWAPFWEPSWSHVGHQDAPGRAQGAPGGRQFNPRGPKRPQDAPRGLQDAPGEPPGSIFCGCLMDF